MAEAAALALSSGVALAVTRQCKTGVPCYGTKERDLMKGSAGNDSMYGKGSGDTLKGFGGSDILRGQGRSDRLFGGSGGDFLYPGPGNDASEGGGDAMDRYLFEAVDNKWGRDTITDTADSDNDPSTGNTVQFYDLSTQLTIALVSDPLSPEVKNASGKSTVNWSNNAIDRVYSESKGDDTIYGNSAANGLITRGGDDDVHAGAGNDYIDVRDNADGD